MIQPWFSEGKLGIFIHWGIYAVEGVEESWAFFRGDMTHEAYMQQLGGFTADNYDPEKWVKALVESGAAYVVISSRHHDGFALWDTRTSLLNSRDASPAGRDLLTPFCCEVRKTDLKLGIYYSLSDWNHPDYASVEHGLWKRRYNQGLGKDAAGDQYGFCYPPEGKEDLYAWDRYRQYIKDQLGELQERYNPDLFWFDGDWERTADQWDVEGIRDQLRSFNPQVIINSRLCGAGDYATPEQTLPFTAPDSPWETCMTMNESWGYRPDDTSYKSHRRIVKMFCEILQLGGNLLLDVGPKADGTIPEAELEILSALGRWNREVMPAVRGTLPGLPWGHVPFPSTQSPDGRTLYLFIHDLPKDEFSVKGLLSKVASIRVLNGPSSGRKLLFTIEGGADWYGIPGLLWISTAGVIEDEVATVLEVSLEKPLNLYEGSAEAFGVEV